MNKLGIGTAAFCGPIALAGLFLLQRVATGDGMSRPAPAVPAAAIAQAGMIRFVTADDRRTARTRVRPASEFPSDSDTTGLLRESLTIDELLDEVNADSGAGFTPVDGASFAALLNSDPALRKALSD